MERHSVTIPPAADGKTFNIAGATVKNGSIPMSLWLKLDDGQTLTVWDRQDLNGDHVNVAVSGRKLTTLNMRTRSNFYDRTLGCLILGFSKDPGEIPERVKELLCSMSARSSRRAPAPAICRPASHAGWNMHATASGAVSGAPR